jgi:DNA invertase Pin-like site-specific DNA recombinase
MRVTYVRTSTSKQDGKAQAHALQQAAKARGWRTCLKLVDLDESGKKASRPALDELRRRARGGEVRELLVTAIDRLGRTAGDVCVLLEELTGAGVVVHSLREGTIDVSTPIGRFIVQIITGLAEMEHGLITERVKGGIARAREHGTRSGKAIGRPRRDVDVAKVRELREQGKSWRLIAQTLRVPRRTLERAASANSLN